MPGVRDERQLVRTDIAKGARMLEELLQDKARLKATGATGRKAWREHFTWQRIAERYAAAYSQLVKP